jgi:phosphate starvation-inducible protein PhoH
MAKKTKKTAQNNNQNTNNHFELRTIKPLTANQQLTFDYYKEGYNLVCHGYAGTGKTFCALYLALNEILSGNSQFERIVLIRSVVPSRDIGFLPGSIKEKIAVYEEPYKEICDDLFGRGDGYNILKMKKLINFTTTSFLRGMTFNNSIVIVDEVQNLSYSELYTTITRLGDSSKLILCGDFRQTDLKPQEHNNSLMHIMNIMKRMPNMRTVEYEAVDIIRGRFVRDFIIKATEYEEKLPNRIR